MASLGPRLALSLRVLCPVPLVRHINFFPSLPSSSSSSPLATSSSTTLDDLESWESTDPLVASLVYATDNELIDAILADTPPSASKTSTPPARSRSRRGHVSPYNLDWTSSVDPAFAFLALRQRPTFNQFIEHVRPKLSQVFESLKASGMHQLIASDIMLRNGDPRVLRELLEVVAGSKATLRPSAVMAIYMSIRSRLADQSLRPLSGSANRTVAIAMMAEGDRVLLPEVFDALYDSLEWSSATAWSFLSIILEMTRHDHLDTALAMVRRLLEDKRIPSSATARHNDPGHPEAKKIFIQSIVIRTCLENRLYGHVQKALDQLMSTLEQSTLTDSTAELVMEICRASIAGRVPEQVKWAGTIIQRFANIPNAPPIPGSLIDAFIANTSRTVAAELYLSLPPSRNPPSPASFIRLARAKFPPTIILELLKDVHKYAPPEFVAQRPAFIECLIHAKRPDAVKELYETWRETLRLDFATMYSIVCAFTQGRHRKEDREFVAGVIEDYAGCTLPSTVNDLGLARAYRRAHDPRKAMGYLAGINPADPTFTGYMDALVQNHPVESYRLIKLLYRVGITTYPATDSIVTACTNGEWAKLDQLRHPDLANDGSESGSVILALKAIRRGRLAAASRKIHELDQAGTMVDLQAYKLMIERCIGYGRWQLALQTWLLIAKSTGKQSAADNQRLIRRIGRTILSRMNAVLRNAVTDIGPILQLIQTDLFKEYRNALNGMMRVERGDGGTSPFPVVGHADLSAETETMLRNVERLAELRSSVEASRGVLA